MFFLFLLLFLCVFLLDYATKIFIFIEGGSRNFQSSFRGGSFGSVPNGEGGSCDFFPPHFKMLWLLPLLLLGAVEQLAIMGHVTHILA